MQITTALQLITKPRQLLDSYLEVISLIEHTYRDYLASISRHLAQMGLDDVNPLQASILFHIGEHKVAVNQIRTRGNYLELCAEVGDGLTGRRRRIVGVFEPPLLQRRSDTP